MKLQGRASSSASSPLSAREKERELCVFVCVRACGERAPLASLSLSLRERERARAREKERGREREGQRERERMRERERERERERC